MALTALKRQPAEQLATDALRDAILTGSVKLGERLTEVELADQFKVSRGTVRLALHQLSSDGLVVLKPYSGWSVITLEPRDMWEIYTMRGGLEATGARLAAEQLDEDGARQLEQAGELLFEGVRNAVGLDEIKRRDFALHRCIVELAKNSRLSHHYRLVEQQVRLFLSTTYSENYKEAVIEHHRPIVEAILSRNPTLAATLSADHCMSEGNRILRASEETDDRT
ncbi:GntR family transcriptional regulator [Tropicimonas sp. IMCC34011]|uniref:GntR family transcriptional regulator n=1 Tax=Tropicimonas sp. IMCC34011 TaxID=2248759 RepID=UPI000E2365E8|nr:GntR family transcriptional regulator [Tropicimonas sp. IMCC34011]